MQIQIVIMACVTTACCNARDILDNIDYTSQGLKVASKENTKLDNLLLEGVEKIIENRVSEMEERLISLLRKEMPEYDRSRSQIHAEGERNHEMFRTILGECSAN